jgi:hypothetical protein
MAEKYLKCPNCGRGVPDNVRFCEFCGRPVGDAVAQMSVQSPTVKKANTSWIVVVVVVLILLGAGIGAVYSMPWSKIKLIVEQNQHGQIGVDVYINGVLKASVGIGLGTTIVGVWSVVAGSHMVQVDGGEWHQGVITHLFSPDEYYWYYEGPDGTADISYTYEVGPLSTKNVYYNL